MTNSVGVQLTRVAVSVRTRQSPRASRQVEWVSALAAVTRRIEAQTGMPIAALHAQLGQQLAAGELPQDMDTGFVRQYLATDKALEATRAALAVPATGLTGAL